MSFYNRARAIAALLLGGAVAAPVLADEAPKPKAFGKNHGTPRGKHRLSRKGHHDPVTGVRLTVKYPANGHQP